MELNKYYNIFFRIWTMALWIKELLFRNRHLCVMYINLTGHLNIKTWISDYLSAIQITICITGTSCLLFEYPKHVLDLNTRLVLYSDPRFILFHDENWWSTKKYVVSLKLNYFLSSFKTLQLCGPMLKCSPPSLQIGKVSSSFTSFLQLSLGLEHIQDWQDQHHQIQLQSILPVKTNR